jgi:hypothetical protein
MVSKVLSDTCKAELEMEIPAPAAVSASQNLLPVIVALEEVIPIIKAACDPICALNNELLTRSADSMSTTPGHLDPSFARTVTFDSAKEAD